MRSKKMDPNSDASKRDPEDAHQRQGDDLASVTPSPSDGASATTGMLQVPVAAMMTPPVPDAQIITALEQEVSDEEAALEEDFIDEEAAGKGKKRSRRKKKKKSRGKRRPREKLDVIEDDDPPPMPADSMNNEDAAIKGKARKGPERIGDDDDAPPDHFASSHDGEGNNIKPAAVTQSPPHPRTQVRQSHATVPPSRPNRIVQDQASTRPRVRLTPQSMLPRSSIGSNTQAPSAPILEARLVEEEPPAPVYDATAVQSEVELSWWKKHRSYVLLIGMVLVLGVVVVVMSNLRGPQGSKDGGPDIREGGTWIQQAKLLTNDGAAEDYFGSAVSVDGDTVVVGAPHDDFNGSGSGSAYVFIRVRGTWIQQAKLLPNDGAADDWFGNAVAISGDTVVVGAYTDDGNGRDSGSAYVFIREGDTWKQQAKLLPNDVAHYDHFSRSVSVSGDIVVVGAPEDDDNGSNSGLAYVFVREEGTWTQQAKLLPNDGAAGDNFGIAVSVSGNTVVVGALWDDDNGSGSGSAYVFIHEGGTWKQQAKLLPNDGAADDRFGYAVAISGNTVVVGAWQDGDNGSSSGSAYVFIWEGNTWKQQAKLLPNDGATGDNFGRAVAISGDTVVVGFNYDDDNGDASGSAYTFLLQS